LFKEIKTTTFIHQSCIKLIKCDCKDINKVTNYFMWIMLKGSCDREDWSNGAENSALHLKTTHSAQE